jgi:O-antigen/teichoic acid export membrane protein
MKFLQHKLTKDIAWTMGCLVVLAASGILINLIIAHLRDVDSLGVFNQVYAIYIVASQFAVFGLQYSALRHAALYDSDEAERGKMLVNAGASVLLLGACAAISVYLAAPLFGRFLASTAVEDAICYAAPGLLLFPLNKVLLAYLNGLRRAKAYSVLQSGRYILVTLWVAALSASPYPFEYTTLGFFVAELVTTSGVYFYLLFRNMLPTLRFDPAWTRRNFAFGGKSMLAGIFVEMNSRIDVLLVGFFLPDREVGIYSFAAMLVDGLYHVLAFIRLNYNPLLVGYIRDSDWAGAKRLLVQTKRYVLPVTVLLSLSVLAVFVVLTTVIVPEKGLDQGLLPLSILITGMTLVSVFIPFDNLMLVSGHPGYQTMQNMIIVLTTIVMNTALIPLLGINGAAIAMALGYISGVTVLVYLVSRFLGWNLLTNLVTGRTSQGFAGGARD